jgi:hypothetical protein
MSRPVISSVTGVVYRVTAMTSPDTANDGADAGADKVQPEREARQSVMLNAIVEHFRRGSSTRHRVRNLSGGGVRIDQAGAFEVGATVLVTVGALAAVAATVVWVRDGAAGLKFTWPINPDEARADTMIAPRRTTDRPQPTGAAPSAGWMPSLVSPYRNRSTR